MVRKVQLALGLLWTRIRPTKYNGRKSTGNYLHKIRCERVNEVRQTALVANLFGIAWGIKDVSWRKRKYCNGGKIGEVWNNTVEKEWVCRPM